MIDLASGHDLASDLIRNGAYFWLLSAAISTMPTPGPAARWWVRWCHDFLQCVGANLKQVGARKNGEVK